MNTERNPIGAHGVCKVDTYTRISLTVIAVLLAVVAAGLWGQGANVTPVAEAQVEQQPGRAAMILPDSGRQRQQMIAEMQAMRTSLAEMQEVLANGQVKVVVVSADQSDRGAEHAVPPPTSR